MDDFSSQYEQLALKEWSSAQACTLCQKKFQL